MFQFASRIETRVLRNNKNAMSRAHVSIRFANRNSRASHDKNKERQQKTCKHVLLSFFIFALLMANAQKKPHRFLCEAISAP